MSNGSNLVLLKRTEMQGEALIIKSFLESQNIAIHLMDYADTLNYIGASGIRIMVAEKDLDKAIELLKNTDLSIEE